jgi:hypothetical protein
MRLARRKDAPQRRYEANDDLVNQDRDKDREAGHGKGDRKDDCD